MLAELIVGRFRFLDPIGRNLVQYQMSFLVPDRKYIAIMPFFGRCCKSIGIGNLNLFGFKLILQFDTFIDWFPFKNLIYFIVIELFGKPAVFFLERQEICFR